MLGDCKNRSPDGYRELKIYAVVARAGVQPATFALGVRCSMQLSYRADNCILFCLCSSMINDFAAEDGHLDAGLFDLHRIFVEDVVSQNDDIG